MKNKALIIRLLLRIVFLCIPLIIAMTFALKGANDYYSILDNKWFSQTCCFSVGIIVSSVAFCGRLRFLPITLLIAVFLFISGNIIGSLKLQEFDTFFYLIKFKIFSTLFLFGWLCGWGFARFKNFGILLAALFITVAIVLTVSQSLSYYYNITTIFVPIVIFGIYIIYTSNAVRNISIQGFEKAHFLSFLRNLFGILILFMSIMIILYLLAKTEFMQIEETWSKDTKKEQSNSLLEKNESDSTFKIKEKLKPNPTFASGKGNPAPVFVAYINSFIDNENKIPNPYYFVVNYLTNFDLQTETFEKDSIIPYNDLFKVNPSEIEIYFTKTDSSIMRKALSDTLTKSIDIDVYSINISDKEFMAPLTSYFCEPIAVESDFKEKFRSAYKAKSIVSELNSAYFVYPSRDQMLQAYQQTRYIILDSVLFSDFEKLPKDFYNYYTQLPNIEFIDSVKKLTAQITAGVKTPIRKIEAIRNYFFARNQYGESVFKYTENPGIPGIPGASKLQHFLFESHKGYCAHFAGATLFMFRACGIPARLAVGFATMDRSDKNKGWYWFYEDQAHAWVQAYFPKFGWLDFDTTIGNDDMEEAPQPDGTPPMQMNKANFAGSGKIIFVDTAKKIVDINLEKMIFNDVEYKFDEGCEISLDLSFAKIFKDNIQLALRDLRKNIHVLSLSFDDSLKEIKLNKNQSGCKVCEMLPNPLKIDEMRLDKDKKSNKKEKTNTTEISKNNEKTLPVWLLWAFASLFFIFILFLTPYIIYSYYKFKSKFRNKKVNVFYVYKATTFMLNQLKCERGELTPLQYASQVVDKKYNTDFENFMKMYLKCKYASHKITSEERTNAVMFFADFKHKIYAKHKLYSRFASFLNLKQTLKYYKS